MPTRAKKSVKSSAANTTAKKVKKSGSAGTLPVVGIDPPIIVDGGGSVTIYSTDELVPQPPVPDYPFVYYIAVDIGGMDWNGLNHKKDKCKNGKDFNLKLYK